MFRRAWPACMNIPMQPPSLQSAVDKYSKTLKTAESLISLHPRKKGNPGAAAALAPAVVLTSIAAFEAFAEELLASVAGHRGYSYGQIATLVSFNNPTVEFLQGKLSTVLGWKKPDLAQWQPGFSVEVWKPPALGDSTWITTTTLDWTAAATAATAWMQVRHCLTHGLARGTRAELWPGPLKIQNDPNKREPHASDVLRPRPGGKHSLSIHGAESCAQVYREASRALTTAAAHTLSVPAPKWANVPIFVN